SRPRGRHAGLSGAPGGAILDACNLIMRLVQTRRNLMTRLLRYKLAHAAGVALVTLAAGCGEEKPAAPAKPKIQARDTLGKVTQDVRNLKPEIAQGGQVTDGKIHAKDYITLQADAYRTEVAKIAKLNVKHAIDMYEALNGEKPKTYEEFM